MALVCVLLSVLRIIKLIHLSIGYFDHKEAAIRISSAIPWLVVRMIERVRWGSGSTYWKIQFGNAH